MIKNMYFLGQVNGKFSNLINCINKLKITNDLLIQCGNFGLVNSEELIKNQEIIDLNRKLNESNSILYVIRGNHDNPNDFFQTNKLLSNIVLLKDFSAIGEKNEILVWGGGISFDRIERYKKGLYWDNETISYPFSSVDSFSDKKIIVSFKPPPYIFDFNLTDYISYWVRGDACLENQLSKERDETRRFISKLQKNNEIKLFISSGLNISAERIIQDIKYKSLKGMEIFKFC